MVSSGYGLRPPENAVFRRSAFGLGRIGMRALSRAKVIRLTIVSGSVILLDQITKALIKTTIPLHGGVTVIPGFFNISHVQNPGGAFGLLADQSPAIRLVVFILFSAFAAGVILYLYFTVDESTPLLASAIAMIFGGAVGNLIDRIRFGRVVDFLDFYIGTAHWPSFNVADSSVTIGISVFLYHLVFSKIPE